MNPVVSARIAAELEADILLRIVDRRWYRLFKPAWFELIAENTLVLRMELRLYNKARRTALADLDGEMAAGDHFVFPKAAA